MSFFTEYALLFAVSLPMVTIVGMQLCLFLGGERGTLLVPGVSRYPSIEGAKGAVMPMSVAPRAAVAAQCANDEIEREAA